jgi:hypothetical protein
MPGAGSRLAYSWLKYSSSSGGRATRMRGVDAACSLERPGYQAGRTRLTQQLREALRFGLDRVSSKRRQPVIPPAAVVLFSAGASLNLADQPVGEQLLERRIESSRLQRHRTSSAVGDFLHDAVAMPIGVRKGHQDMENGWRQRQEVRQGAFLHS